METINLIPKPLVKQKMLIRQALFFDKLMIDDVDEFIADVTKLNSDEQIIADLQYLQTENILINGAELLKASKYKSEISSLESLWEDAQQIEKDTNDKRLAFYFFMSHCDKILSHELHKVLWLDHSNLVSQPEEVWIKMVMENVSDLVIKRMFLPDSLRAKCLFLQKFQNLNIYPLYPPSWKSIRTDEAKKEIMSEVELLGPTWFGSVTEIHEYALDNIDFDWIYDAAEKFRNRIIGLAHSDLEQGGESFIGKTNIYEIVMEKIPIPMENTPLEKIVDFRKDGDAIHNLKAIKDWSNEIVREKYTKIQAEEKLEYLLSQFQQHLKRHKIKRQMAMAGVVITATKEMIQNPPPWNILSALGAIVKLIQNEVEMISDENPGKEVAYIAQVQEEFKEDEIDSE